MEAASLKGITTAIEDILGAAVPFVAGLALLYFLWGLVIFIAKSGEESARTEGKSKMLWGIVGLFVIVTLWGLVKVISSSFSIDPGGSLGPPQF